MIHSKLHYSDHRFVINCYHSIFYLFSADEDWENDESSSDEGAEIVQVIPLQRNLEITVRDDTNRVRSNRAILNDPVVRDEARTQTSFRVFREPDITTKDVSLMDEKSLGILDEFYQNSKEILTEDLSKEVITNPDDLNNRMFESFLEMSDNYSEEMVDKTEETSFPVKNAESMPSSDPLSVAECQVVACKCVNYHLCIDQ